MNIASLPVGDKSDPSRASHVLAFSDLQGVRQSGDWLRAYCPVHGGDHQRSLSIHVNSGRGQCFCCQVNVQVKDLPSRAASPKQRSHSGSHCGSVSGTVPPAPSSPCWQQEELALLLSLSQNGELDLFHTHAWNARAYLASRHITTQVAQSAGVGYLAPELVQRQQLKRLQRWADRLIFPLLSFEQDKQVRGFAGRLLTGWQQCADENAHKAFLDEQGLQRWLKTRPAGWFWTPSPQEGEANPLIVVEGPFDRLALLCAGFHPSEILALVGTSLGISLSSLTPPLPRCILLAFDDDPSGVSAAKILEQQLTSLDGMKVERCFPASGGKDWSERWAKQGQEGLEALYAHVALMTHSL